MEKETKVETKNFEPETSVEVTEPYANAVIR
jgi:hypothetical protein